MATSKERREASRENGKLGGVKSDEGKEVSRLNATKHGILGAIGTNYDLVNPFEIYDQLAEEFGAETPSRQILIEQLALTILRLGRCARAESEILREGLATRIVKDSDPKIEIWTSVRAECPVESKAKLSMDFLERLAPIYDRYEPRLIGRMLRLLDALRR